MIRHNSIVTNLSKLIFEPIACIDHDFKIRFNINQIPNISFINKKIHTYLLDYPEYKKTFYNYHNLGSFTKNFTNITLPIEVLYLIYQYVIEIKNHIYHLLFNNWYKNYIDLVDNISLDLIITYILTENQFIHINEKLLIVEKKIHHVFANKLASICDKNIYNKPNLYNSRNTAKITYCLRHINDPNI